MKTNYSIWGTAVIAFLSSAAAVHADAAMWEGGYAGAGIAWVNTDLEVEGLGSTDGDGFGFGLFAGYNVAASDNIVVGGELMYSDATVDFDGGGDLDATETSIRLRIGYALEWVMVYGAVGYSKLDISNGGSADDNGLLLAIGSDFMMSPSFSIRGEYSKSMYDDFDGVAGLNIDNDVFALGAAFHF